MNWDYEQIEKVESYMFLNNEDMAACYNAWTQVTENMNTGTWLTSNIHMPNKQDMIESFSEVWA